jgi:hypothetical protein
MNRLKGTLVPYALTALLAIGALAGAGRAAGHPALARAALMGGAPNCSGWNIVPSLNPGSSMNLLYGVAADSASDIWAVGNYTSTTPPTPPQTLIEHWDGTSLSVVPSPNPGTDGNYLYGVAAVSAGDAWAVGNDGGQSLIEQWNGTSWSVVPSPNLGVSDQLNGVAAISADDVWAVGTYSNSGSPSQPLIEHWDGTSWSIVSPPLMRHITSS